MLSNWVGSGAFWVNSSQLGDEPVWFVGAEGFTVERMAWAREIRLVEAGYRTVCSDDCFAAAGQKHICEFVSIARWFDSGNPNCRTDLLVESCGCKFDRPTAAKPKHFHPQPSYAAK
ncbi:hypothetical protein [Tychonema sp. LEGE 07196]|uniref:hypothetical protein n=1 Tax=Tychonema sp. LEGE 07196 TaxID=1828665 RepID=UPI00187F6532